MKKHRLAACLSLLVPSVGFALDLPSEPKPVAEILEERGVTQPEKEVFVTLTRTAYPREALPFNTQATTPEMLKVYDPQNAGDAINRLTSVSVAPQGRLGTTRLAGIRGATSNQTLVLIDGRPMGGVGLAASQDLAEIPNEQIERIEIVRGGVSALYGPNAMGGVINVITQRATHPGKPISDIGIEAGSFGRQAYRLNFGSRYGPTDYFFFGNTQTESGFRDNSDARTHNIGGNVGLSMGQAGKLQLDIAAYHAKTGIPGQLFPGFGYVPPSRYNDDIEKAAATPDARQVTDSGYIRASYLLPMPGDSLGIFRLYGSEREVEFEIPSFFVDTLRREQTKGGEVQVNLPWGVTMGGAFTRDRLDSDDFTTPANHYIARVENWGAFAQEEARWDRLTLIPSIRYDKHSESGDSTNPRIQLIADPAEGLRFSASAGKSFRAPTIDDLFTPFTDFGGGASYVGNPNLRPETGWTYDAGFEVGNDAVSLAAGYFRANITDLIQNTPDMASTTINVGEARRQGAEVELRHRANAYLEHNANYTYLDNQGIPLGFTDFVVLRLSPRHTVNYLATVRPIKKVRFDNSLRYISTRWEGNNETGTKLAPDLLWGMRLAYQLRQLQLFIGVENVAGHRYEERGGFPLPGRTFFGGVTLRLWN